ncbi:MAG: hypothetical protein JNL57_09185 [Bacteroidetes bacterium]|nr:hypothetical protein [Bacteroidota bacterium]
MKNIRWSFLTLLGLLAMVTQSMDCGRCWKYGNCAEDVYFRVFDKTSGKNVFFGAGRKYIPDSAYITSAKNNLYSMQAWGYTNDSLMHVYDLTSSDTFFLKYQGQKDTLAFVYRYEKQDCCELYYRVKSLKYNGNPAVNRNGVWECTK